MQTRREGYFKVQCGQGMSNGELNDMAYLPRYLPTYPREVGSHLCL